MPVVGVVGMSGSGKSKSIEGYVKMGFRHFDDKGGGDNWAEHPRTIRAHADRAECVIVSDILFCCETADDVRPLPNGWGGRSPHSPAASSSDIR